jgi:hypothetical protein
VEIDGNLEVLTDDLGSGLAPLELRKVVECGWIVPLVLEERMEQYALSLGQGLLGNRSTSSFDMGDELLEEGLPLVVGWGVAAGEMGTRGCRMGSACLSKELYRKLFE